MEIWLDTANENFVAHAAGLGVLHGITTNPTILALSTISPDEVIASLLKLQEGLVAVQVLTDDAMEICRQAKKLFSISNRIIVKIPVTQNGLRAMYALKQEGIPTLATAVFEIQQAFLAFKAGASYLALYLGRIADTGKNPLQVISQIHAMKLRYDFKGKIMGAGIRELSTAMACLEMGVCAATLSEKIFSELVKDCEPTLLALEKFSADWSKSNLSVY